MRQEPQKARILMKNYPKCIPHRNIETRIIALKLFKKTRKFFLKKTQSDTRCVKTVQNRKLKTTSAAINVKKRKLKQNYTQKRSIPP